MQFRRIEQIMKENKRHLDMLEEYDRTGHLPTEKMRRSFTITREAYQKLKKEADDRGTSMSALLEKLILQR